MGDSRLVAVPASTSQTYSWPCWHYTTNQAKVEARSTAMVVTIVIVFASKAAMRNPSLEVVAAARTSLVAALVPTDQTLPFQTSE